jgi:hypothetical protein
MSPASEESHGLTIGKELLIVHMQTITKELTQEIPLLAMLDEGTRSSLLEGLEAKEFAEETRGQATYLDWLFDEH